METQKKVIVFEKQFPCTPLRSVMRERQQMSYNKILRPPAHDVLSLEGCVPSKKTSSYLHFIGCGRHWFLYNSLSKSSIHVCIRFSRRLALHFLTRLTLNKG